MSVLQHWREVWQRAQTLSSNNFPPEIAEEANRYAAEAYRSCVAWYGPPKDPQNTYRLEQTPGTSMHCWLFRGTHYITISQQAAAPEQLCEHIAHEMYHRVTAGRKGLAREMWIQEMLACLTAHWFCRHQGFKEYAEDIKNRWLATEGKADVSLLRRSKRNSRRWLLYGEDHYSDAFVTSLTRIGYALTRVLDANHICRLSQAKTLEEWVASLPQEDQYAVCRILELPYSDKIAPDTETGWSRLFNGLKTKGDKEALVSEFEQIVRLHPSNGLAAFYLGRAYQLMRRFDAARDAYLKAIELKFSDKWLPYNLATCYWYTDEFSSAVQWYQEAINHDPQWAAAFNDLALSFIKIGDLLGARAAWKKVLTLDDEDYKKRAQKALQDYPFGDTS